MRSRPLENPEVLDFRFTVLLCGAASVLSFRFLTGNDLSVLLLNYEYWPQEPWRLLTANLLHGSWLHLAFNLYWLWKLGSIVEPIFDLAATAVIMVLLGMISMGAEWAFLAGGIGLSGIVYGLWGLLWALDRYNPNYAGVMDERTTTLFVVWFFICIAATAAGTMAIANIAHGAGALAGATLGLCFAFQPERRTLGRVLFLALLVFTAWAATLGRPLLNHSSQRAWELGHDGYEARVASENEQALEYLLESIERDPTDPYVWNNLSVAYSRLGQWMKAEEASARARQLGLVPDPEDD